MKHLFTFLSLLLIVSNSLFAQETLSNSNEVIEYKLLTWKEKKAFKKEMLPARSSISIGNMYGFFPWGAGIEGDYRLTPRLGLNAGVGLWGYGGAVKYHFRTYSMSGAYLSISYKDVGFGRQQSFGPEIGTVIGFGKNERFGLMLQLGYQFKTYPYESYESEFLKNIHGNSFLAVSAGLTIAIGK